MTLPNKSSSENSRFQIQKKRCQMIKSAEDECVKDSGRGKRELKKRVKRSLVEERRGVSGLQPSCQSTGVFA